MQFIIEVKSPIKRTRETLQVEQIDRVILAIKRLLTPLLRS